MSATHSVYRVYDTAGRLLYVGCSSDVPARLRQHQQNAQWWLFHARVTTEDFPTREAGREAEERATEHPRWNITGRSPEHPDGFCTTIQGAHWLDYERSVSNRNRDLLAEEARLTKALRKVRMGLAGTRLEIAAIRDGFELDLEDIA